MEGATIAVRDGVATDPASGRSLGYGDLAGDADSARGLGSAVPADVRLTPVDQWEVLGQPLARPNGRDVVAGTHQYPSDIVRPGMLYGRVLRPASYGAKLVALDLAPARGVEGAVVVRDGDFVGVAAPSTWLAQQALDALADSAKWEPAPHPPSAEVYAYLRAHVRDPIPADPFAREREQAAKTFKATYHVAYVQHAPLEPRAAVAEWSDGKLTAWTGTQVPFGVKAELVRAFGLTDDKVRVIVPDFGGGFGGKHSGECAVEAARLAKGGEQAGQAGLDPGRGVHLGPVSPRRRDRRRGKPRHFAGKLTSWHFVNINSGAAEIQTPYRVAKNQCKYVACDPPLRHGSYRGLAATANHFARESFMDELAEAHGAGTRWSSACSRIWPIPADQGRSSKRRPVGSTGRPGARSKAKNPERRGGSGVRDRQGVVRRRLRRGRSWTATKGEIRRPEGSSQVFECGKILNPSNRHEAAGEGGLDHHGPWPCAPGSDGPSRGARSPTPRSACYLVPRFADLPELDIDLIDHPDLPSAGAGETPLIALAPAIANAVHAATGQRIREMPIRLPGHERPEGIADA